MFEAVALALEIGVEGGFQCGDGLLGSGEGGEIAEMPGSERNHHESDAVGGDEVGAVGAVDIVTGGRSAGAVDLYLGEVAERSGGREGDVFEGEHDVRPGPGGGAAVDCRRDREGGVQSGGDIPCGQYVVHHTVMVAGAGDLREAECGVDGVVHGGPAVAAPEEFQCDDVRAQCGERVVAHPGPAARVGHQDSVARPGCGDQAPDDVLAGLAAQIEADRPLTPVEAGPVDGCSGAGERPAAGIGGSAERVDPDDLGAELAQREPAQGGGDETRDLDDPESGEWAVGSVFGCCHAGSPSIVSAAELGGS